MRIYLSGPMSGLPDFGYPIFREHAARLRARGFDIIDPSENFGGDSGRDRTEYMRLDVQHVLDAEAVAVLPGWEKSRGARLEVSIARELGLPVFDAARLEQSDLHVTSWTPDQLRSCELITGDPRFHALLFEIAALHDRKQADYGTGADAFANVRASQEFGVAPWVGTLIRANDKWTRIKSLLRKGYLVNESLDDSLMDISVYALIALILKREQEGQA